MFFSGSRSMARGKIMILTPDSHSILLENQISGYKYYSPEIPRTKHITHILILPPWKLNRVWRLTLLFYNPMLDIFEPNQGIVQ